VLTENRSRWDAESWIGRYCYVRAYDLTPGWPSYQTVMKQVLPQQGAVA
jgi:hypothetical protein